MKLSSALAVAFVLVPVCSQGGGNAEDRKETPITLKAALDRGTIDNIFDHVMRSGQSGDAFDGPGFFLFHHEASGETLVINAPAREDALQVYEDKDKKHFSGLVVIHMFETPGCAQLGKAPAEGAAADGGPMEIKNWIYRLGFNGDLQSVGHHAFCVTGKGKFKKRIREPNSRDVDEYVSPQDPEVRDAFEKLSARLPKLVRTERSTGWGG